MSDETALYGDHFFVYRTPSGKLRLSVVALDHLESAGILRLNTAPAGEVTPDELTAWQDGLRRNGIMSQLLPPERAD